MEGSSEFLSNKLLLKMRVTVLLACSPRTVDCVVANGQLTAVRILGGIRFRLSDVQSIMDGGAL